MNARGLCCLEKGTDQRNKTEQSLNDVDKTPGIHLNTEIRIFVFNIKCIPFDIPRRDAALTSYPGKWVTHGRCTSEEGKQPPWTFEDAFDEFAILYS